MTTVDITDRAPTDLDAHVPRLAALLGWGGRLLGPLWVAGRRVMAVTELLDDVHELRQRRGFPPVLDLITLETWLLPEFKNRAPHPAVRVRGVIVPLRHWPLVGYAAAPCTGIAPTVVLLPSVSRRPSPHDSWIIPGRLGLAVSGEHGIDVLRDPPCPASSPVSGVHHWLFLESLYSLLLQREDTR